MRTGLIMRAAMRTTIGMGVLSMLVVGCTSGQPSVPTSPSPSPKAESSKPEPSPSPKTEPTPIEKSEVVAPSKASSEPTKTEKKTEMTSKSASTVPVQVYRMDGACSSLVPKTENLPKDKALEAAVGEVIRQSNSADFTVSDYRVKQDGSTATIVLRLPPTAKRPFTAMSSCEQMALFGALRETLLSRSEWKIRDIEFSDGKKAIAF